MISTNHNLEDDRIFWKEASSLKKAGYKVFHIGVVTGNNSRYEKNGIELISVERPSYSKNTSLNNMISWLLRDSLEKRIANEAKNTNAHVFHLHDFRLYRIIDRLKRQRQAPRIIFDIHDPHIQNLVDYRFNARYPAFTTNMLAFMFRRYELRALKKCDEIIVTEPNLCHYFEKKLRGKNVSIVYNYANVQPSGRRDKKWDALYCGTVTRARGILQIINATSIISRKIPGYKVCIVGKIWGKDLRAEINKLLEDNGTGKNITLIDEVPYDTIGQFYEQSKVGLALFQPIKTHEIIMPIKLFEYLQFGLPIVGCQFGHIKAFIERESIGMSIDSTNTIEIANTLIELAENQALYNSFSTHCRNSSTRYSWAKMEPAFIEIYHRLTMKYKSFEILTVLQHEWQASILAEMLGDEGIANFVESNSCFGPTTGISVHVDSSKLEHARSILTLFDTSKPGEHGN